MKKAALFLVFRFFVLVPIVMGQNIVPASQIKKGYGLKADANNALTVDTSVIHGGGGGSTDTTSLSNRINLKVNISDTAAMLLPYLRKVDTTLMLSPYMRKVDTLTLSNRINLKLSISDTASMLSVYLRSIDTTAMLSPYLRSIDATATYSVLGHTHTFASLTSKPTTIAGYGITDFNSLGDARWSLLAHAHDSSTVTGLHTENYFNTKYYPLSSNPAGYLTSVGALDSTTISGFHTYNFYNTVYTPLTRTLTINGSSQDLSANRTWSVGTVTSIATTSPITGGTITGTGTIAIDTSIVHSYNYNEARYQAKLISGTNIKTINGSSVLGSGDLAITGSGSPTAFDFTDQTNVNVSTVITSSSVVLAGDTTVVWSFAIRGNSTAQMKVNSNSWTTEGIARVGDTLTIRITSSSSNSTAVTCFLRCNGAVIDWHVTTAAFVPSQISGMKLWLDISVGVTKDGSDKVSQWNDQSGNANHATQSTAGNKPLWVANQINGLPVIRFDGTDDFMGFTAITTIRTVFWVMKYAVNSQNAVPIMGHATLYDFHGGDGAITTNVFNNTDANAFIRSSGSIYENGVQHTPVAGSGGYAKPTSYKCISLVTGGNVAAQYITNDRNLGRCLQGDFVEIIIYDSALGTTDRQNVETYLMNKYGL